MLFILWYLPYCAKGVKVHKEICFDNQNVKVKKGVTSFFDALTGHPPSKKKKKKKREIKRKKRLRLFPLRPYFILRKLAGSQHNQDVSQWADSHKNKETKFLPILTDE